MGDREDMGVRAGSCASHGTGDAVSALRASIPDAMDGCGSFHVPDGVTIRRATRGYIMSASPEAQGLMIDQFAFTTVAELALFLFAMWDAPELPQSTPSQEQE